jgi:hypothetical protein
MRAMNPADPDLGVDFAISRTIAQVHGGTLVANDRSKAVHAFVSACRFRPDRDRL